MKRYGIALLIASALICSGGCFTRTIYVPDGAPVRLRKPIKKAAVWVRDGKGKWVEGTVTLHEGWYALPDPGAGKNGP